MPLIARRRADETWRLAVERRAAEFGRDGPCLVFFDASRAAAGLGEAEAAFRALAEFQCLWEESRAPEEASAAAAPRAPRHPDHRLPQV
jgi:hypothetical protein